jgi:hypothetical protein
LEYLRSAGELIVVAERLIFCLVKDQRHIKFSFSFFEQDLQSRGIQEEVLEFWIGSIQSQDKIDLDYFVSRRVQHSHGSIPIEPSQKKGNSARLRAPEDRGGLSSSDHSRAMTPAYLCQSRQVQKGKYKRKLRRGITCRSGYVVLIAMRKSRRSDRSVLITFISVSLVLIREKKKEGKRSNCLVRKTFSMCHQRKNKFGANQFGLQVDTNSREFPMIIADSREV